MNTILFIIFCMVCLVFAIAYSKYTGEHFSEFLEYFLEQERRK